MKIAVAQLNYHIGNFAGNLEKMRNAVAEAKKGGADLICFSELATCGYPPRDFLEFKDFIRLSEASVEALKADSGDIGIVVGSPSVNPVLEGKDLYNSCYFLYRGEVIHMQHKTLLPTYDIFDEYRYFEPATSWQVVEFKGERIALSICEDIWNLGNENPLYTICPLDEMMAQAPTMIINISASPYDHDQVTERLHVIRSNVDKYQVPLIYINHCGAQTEIIFDGGSLIMSPNGKIYDELPYFREAIRIYAMESVRQGNRDRPQPWNKIRMMHDALITGVRDYFHKLGFRQAILGLSGGLDSAVTAAIAVEALGSENVRGILMPSEFSSGHSVRDAELLAQNLGMPYDIIPINGPYNTFMDILEPYFQGLPFDVAEENIQSRSRGIILMALSNKFGYILLNTTNKSELAVGYGTLYGDLAGGLSVIGDVYKTEAYALAEYVNRESEVIPQNIIDKPPSAELRHDQKDTDSLPPYDLLDPILYAYIEKRHGPNEIIAMGHDEEVVRKALRLVNINEYKRHQTAPVLRVSPKAFGIGRRMPIVGKYLN